MDHTSPELIEAIRSVAARLPADTVAALADIVGDCETALTPKARAKALNVVAEPSYRARVAKLLDRWAREGAHVSPTAMALALRAAVCCEEHRRHDESVDLVWTGPTTDATPLRRTDQALLEVINSAQETLTVVSFAVYKVKGIADALVAAAGRGVTMRIILETAASGAGKNDYDTIRALGPEVESRAEVYLWPLDNRPKDKSGKHGSLHAKCAVADGRKLFISSANLTDYAMTLNMELGVLLTGGSLPKRVESHFGRLIEQEVLQRL